ncbi:MAG: putative RNA-binding protein YlqC (UPF0109 family) [Flavobacteriaceae bacterium]|jgi:predicted RNA-binding protein YlqC (UPF0109 family)
MQEQDQIFLEHVITSLVDHPESVKVDRKVDDMGVLLTLHVHPEDMGKVIGRSGNTAKAVRTLLRVIGMKFNSRVNLKIEEPEGSEHVHTPVESSPVESAPVMEAPQSADPTAALDEAMDELKGL